MIKYLPNTILLTITAETNVTVSFNRLLSFINSYKQTAIWCKMFLSVYIYIYIYIYIGY